MYFCTAKFGLTDGVTGNTSDFDSEKSRFEPWSVNHNKEESKKFDSSFYLDSEQGEKWFLSTIENKRIVEGRFLSTIENVSRVADGLPAHKYRKLNEKGGLAATRCYGTLEIYC